MTDIIKFSDHAMEAEPQEVAVQEVVEAPAVSEPVYDTVIFRDQEVKLAYPLLALARMEERGVSLSALDSEEVSITTLATLVWAGLCLRFPDATVDEVLTTYGISDMERLSQAVSLAFNRVGK